MMLLRGCAPHWIAVDEITAPEDIDSMERSTYCGVFVAATAHASDMQDLKKRPLYRNLLERKLFEYIVMMERDHRYRIHVAEELYD